MMELDRVAVMSTVTLILLGMVVAKIFFIIHVMLDTRSAFHLEAAI